MEKRVPLRQCLGCRQMKSKRDLVRIIRTKDGQVLFDSTGKLSGRGAYVCNSVSCFEKANKSGAFSKALGAAIPDDVLNLVRNQMM